MVETCHYSLVCMHMKTPLMYYGGKTLLLPHILPLLPNHITYCEPFVGGGAVFWAKQPSIIEVINDTDGQVVNFYQVLKNNFSELKKKIDATLYSRATYKVAIAIYQMPQLFDSITYAWSHWILITQGFSGTIGSWTYDRKNKKTNTFHIKKFEFTESLSARLDHVTIEHHDALHIIHIRDTVETFFYIDPPYINANQGHYHGYTEAYFIKLLDMLTTIKGKFLLSCYPSELVTSYITKNSWYSKHIEKLITASLVTETGKRERKIEILVANYPIE